MRTEVPEIPRSQVLLEPRAIPASISLPTDRLASVDRLRILAAIGIVWFHTDGAPYRQIGYAGLPIFLLIFFSLITRQDGIRTTSQFLRHRYCRLLKPWLFWSVVYGLCRLVKVLHTMDVPGLWEMFSIETVVVGTSIHLWYLPYAFVSGLAVYAINRRTAKIDHAVIVVVATAVGAITLAACVMGVANRSLPRPLAQWEFGLAAIPLGLAMGRCLALSSRRLQKTLLTVICLVVLVEGQLLQSLDVGAMTIPYSIAMVAVCIAYCWETGTNAFIATLAPVTFGVYLIHPLVIYGLQQILAPNRHYGLFVSLTVCVSALVTRVLMRTPIRRFL